MFGASLATFSVILVSSIFSMPISGTHTMIGALIGAGLANKENIDWINFIQMVFSWFLSPMLSMF